MLKKPVNYCNDNSKPSDFHLFNISTLFSCSARRKHAIVWSHISMGYFEKKSFSDTRVDIFAFQISKNNLYNLRNDSLNQNQSQIKIIINGRQRF